MATLHPFRALRPKPADAARIAAVPYDVVSTDEARALADGQPAESSSACRAPSSSCPPAPIRTLDAVYQRADENFTALRDRLAGLEDEPSVYFYRLRMGATSRPASPPAFRSTSTIATSSRSTSGRGATRRTTARATCRARRADRAGVPHLPRARRRRSHRRRGDVDGEPLFDFTAPDGVQHTLWRVGGADRDRARRPRSRRIPALYIADGHHRAASAARARRDARAAGDVARRRRRCTTMLAVAFPHDQVQILPYNRTVKDLGGLTPDEFLEAVARAIRRWRPGPATPARRGDIAMYFQGGWHTLRPRIPPDASDPIASLDVSVLQEGLLAPVLKIADVRTDKRIDFVGGARGTGELERLVDSGKAAVAFSLYPVSVADLMAVSDAGEIMPPKSTWFEPKLRDGLLIHVI